MKDECIVTFLDRIVETNMNLNEVVEQGADILAGLSGVILAIVLTQVYSTTGIQKIGFIIISITSFLVLLLAIGAIRPKTKPKRTNQMYYLGVLELDREEYRKEIFDTIDKKEDLINEYIDEIYDLAEELKPKFKMLKLGFDLLVIGLLIGFIFIIFS